MRALLLDVEEPSCLGAPLYLSPHARYLYGCLRAIGVTDESCHYATIDEIRDD